MLFSPTNPSHWTSTKTRIETQDIAVSVSITDLPLTEHPPKQGLKPTECFHSESISGRPLTEHPPKQGLKHAEAYLGLDTQVLSLNIHQNKDWNSDATVARCSLPNLSLNIHQNKDWNSNGTFLDRVDSTSHWTSTKTRIETLPGIQLLNHSYTPLTEHPPKQGLKPESTYYLDQDYDLSLNIHQNKDWNFKTTP